MSILAAYVVPHPPLIIPHVGKGEERAIQDTIDAYRQVARKIAELKPETIVISSPHSALYNDYFHISPGVHAQGNLAQFGDRNDRFEVTYDVEFVDALEQTATRAGLPAGTLGELDPSLDHATLVPLHFINEAFGITDGDATQVYQVVRIGLSGLSAMKHYELGKCIAQVAERLERRVVYIASGDLSHHLKDEGPYGFTAEGPLFDKQLTTALAHKDFSKLFEFDETFCEKAGECGLRSFQIMAGALDGKAVEGGLLSYEGPFGVGYAVATFEVSGQDSRREFDKLYIAAQKEQAHQARNGEDVYVRIARLSVETFVKTGERLSLEEAKTIMTDLPQEILQREAGTFVSLKKHGQLRGCIGTISSTTDCIAEEILQNAISACSEDPRFEPVEEDELDSLVYSVDVLGDAESIASAHELDTKRYGVIVTKGFKRGLLLPNLEGIDTPENQISIAKQKAGIGQNETVSLQRFEVVRHT